MTYMSESKSIVSREYFATFLTKTMCLEHMDIHMGAHMELTCITYSHIIQVSVLV